MVKIERNVVGVPPISVVKTEAVGVAIAEPPSPSAEFAVLCPLVNARKEESTEAAFKKLERGMVIQWLYSSAGEAMIETRIN